MALKYIIFFLIIPSIGFSQEILKNSGHSYYDCWGYNINATYLASETVDIRWDSTDIPNGTLKKGTNKSHWNYLVREYYCDCKSSAEGKPPKILSISYFRNGRKHGTWTTYFENGLMQSITFFKNDTIIRKKRYTKDGKKYNGKFIGVEFNYAYQKKMPMYIEKYSQGLLISGIYYIDESPFSNPKTKELKIEYVFKKE